jgi:hypothetical protein
MRTSLLQIQAKETRRTSVDVQLINIMAEASRTQVGVYLVFQEQSRVKLMPKRHTNSIFDYPRMYGKLIS